MKSKKPSGKRNHKKTKLRKKPAISLTDEEYAEIFFAAIYPSQKAEKSSKATASPDKEKGAPTEKTVAKSKPEISMTNKPRADIVAVSQESAKSQSPTPADSPGNKAKTPSEIGDLKSNPIEYSDPSSISTFNSEDFKTNAVFSTPILSANNSILMSQPPRSLSKRERLLWLQERRCNGMYVICDHADCGKWRWLENPDPVDLPSKWYCDMNPDAALASCSVPEVPIPNRVEDDLVQNCYTTGSIVWAKLSGYPWWPAMVDDCPDCEQYYWVNDNTASGIPNWYHVVFFDNIQVTRRWIRVKNLKSFKHNPDFDIKFKTKPAYKRRLNMAKHEATIASSLHIRDRLKKYSFLALWNQEIPEYLTSDEDLDGDESYIDYERRIKKKIIQRKKAALKNRNQDVRSKNETSTNSNQQREDKKSVTSNIDPKINNSQHTNKILADKTKRNNLTENKVNHSTKDKIVSEKKSVPQEKCKGKENIKGASKQIFESKPPNSKTDTGLDNSNNLVSRPVDHLLKGNNFTCDKDLAQQIYDGFLNMYNSGEQGQQEIVKLYKEMCSKNNSSESSPKSDTNKDSVKCIANSIEENGESTSKNKPLQTSHKEELIQKRKKVGNLVREKTDINSSKSSPKSDINKDSVNCISNSVEDGNKDKKNENGESTSKNKPLQTSHKEELIQKRKKVGNLVREKTDINSSKSSPKSDINKDSVNCISNSVEDGNKDKKNENGESTSKNKPLQTSHKEEHFKKRKNEDKFFSGDTAIKKKVKKSFIVPVKKS